MKLITKPAVKYLEFYCDTISPYAYFTALLLPAIADKHKLPIVVRPILFAGLLNASGGKGPAEVPLKRRYMFLDCLRLEQQFGIPFNAPPKHPYNPLLALRSANLIKDHEQRLQYVTALLKACWSDGQDLTNTAILQAIARQCGQPEDIVSRSASDEAKALLRQSTEDAVSKGVFGVPTVAAGDELFWGSDRLSHLDSYLSGKLGIDYDKLDKILNIPRGSDRKAFRGD